MNLNDFFNELKRRNVFKGTVSYLVFAWVLLQVIAILTPISSKPKLEKTAIGITIAMVSTMALEKSVLLRNLMSSL